jgi:hypothetical protein
MITPEPSCAAAHDLSWWNVMFDEEVVSVLGQLRESSRGFHPGGRVGIAEPLEVLGKRCCRQRPLLDGPIYLILERGHHDSLPVRIVAYTLPHPDSGCEQVGGIRAAMTTVGGGVGRDRSGCRGGIGHFKQHRAVATRYDKLVRRYQATVTITAINGWL